MWGKLKSQKQSWRAGSSGSKGVITGIPLSVNMRELVENLKVHSSSVRNAKRMTRKAQKNHVWKVRVEYKTKVL